MKHSAFVFGLALLLLAMPSPGTAAAAAEAQVVVAALAYASPHPGRNEDSLSAVERQELRLREFQNLLSLMLSSHKSYETWPGRQRSDCVEPLFGSTGDRYYDPGWTDRCQAILGEVQGTYHFAFNPYQHANTLQRIDIVIPGTSWTQKKKIIDRLTPLLGIAVPTRPKGMPKNSPLTWRWKVGQGAAWIVEENRSGQPLTHFAWYRPAQPPKAVCPVTPTSIAMTAIHRVVTLAELLAGQS
jgi:hypothetical protein